MVQETHMKCDERAKFSGNFFLLQIFGKRTKNGPKTGFFESIDFLHTSRDLCKLKKRLKIFGVSIVKNGRGQSGDSTLKLTVSQK